MTTATATAPAKEARDNGKGKLPTHVAKVRTGYGKNVSFERIGVAWVNDDGSLYVKLHGTQIVSNFALYEIADNAEAGA